MYDVVDFYRKQKDVTMAAAEKWLTGKSIVLALCSNLQRVFIVISFAVPGGNRAKLMQ